MCQLTFTNLGDSYLNAAYVVAQSFVNTLTDHKDGFGFFNEGRKIFKTAVCPSNCTDLGSFIGKVNKNPVISHVRKATLTGGKKMVTLEKSHPFETDNIILAHNGTLELKTTSTFYKNTYADLIDSEIFLSVLDHFYKEENNFLTALTKAYAEFDGKFAFLTYVKPENSFYVIRGETAKLFKKDVTVGDEKIGFIVNTDKDSLESGFLLFRNILLVRGITIDYNGDSVELNKNTVYKFNRETNDLDIIGELVETKKAFPLSARASYYYDDDSSWYTSRYQENTVITLNKNRGKRADSSSKLVKDIFELCLDWGISLRYFDALLFYTIDKGLLECTEEDLLFFMKKILPTIRAWCSDKSLPKEWKVLFPGINRNDLQTSCKMGIQFPYVLETRFTSLINIKKEMDAKNSLQ